MIRSYDYDKRGNQTNEYVDGLLNKTFSFDTTNTLSKVVDSEKGELENQYNGLDFRVASIRHEERIEYLCDLSRDCYNMLEGMYLLYYPENTRQTIDVYYVCKEDVTK